MRLQSNLFRALAAICVLALIGYLGFECYRLGNEKQELAENLGKAESRNRLINRKYKEEKALVGRMQRENLVLEGQARQAGMDAKAFEKENVRLSGERAEMEKRLLACSDERKHLAERIEASKAEFDQLNGKYNQTTAALKTMEGKNEGLKSDIQSLKADLSRSESQGRRYYAHNQRLAQIARELVARTEKEELGTSILVKEPLIQFKRAELEKLLQQYLDRIDDESAIQ